MRAGTDEGTHQVYRYICKDKTHILKELMEEYNPKAFWFYIPDVSEQPLAKAKGFLAQI